MGPASSGAGLRNPIAVPTNTPPQLQSVIKLEGSKLERKGIASRRKKHESTITTTITKRIRLDPESSAHA